MYHFYFDEAKPHSEHNQQYFLITAVGVEHRFLDNITKQLDVIAKKYLPNVNSGGDVEFHGCDIIQGKGLYKSLKVEIRLNLYEDILSLVDKNRNIIKLIYIWVNTRSEKLKYYNKHTPQDWALVFLVEKVDEYMATLETVGRLIGDKDDEVHHRNIEQFKNFKQYKTYGYLGKNIHNIEGLRYEDSVRNRLIQLADMVNYARVVTTYEQNASLKKALKRLFKSYDWFPDKYKVWPPT